MPAREALVRPSLAYGAMNDVCYTCSLGGLHHRHTLAPFEVTTGWVRPENGKQGMNACHRRIKRARIIEIARNKFSPFRRKGDGSRRIVFAHHGAHRLAGAQQAASGRAALYACRTDDEMDRVGHSGHPGIGFK